MKPELEELWEKLDEKQQEILKNCSNNDQELLNKNLKLLKDIYEHSPLIKNIDDSNQKLRNAYGILLDKITPEKDGRKTINRSRVIDKNNGLLWEQVQKGEFVTLLDGEIIYKKQIKDKKFIVKPIDFKQDFGDIGINLPISPIEYGTPEELYNKIRTHIGKYVITSKWFLDISGRYILITWVTEKLNTMSYLKAFGDWGSGKSRWLDVIGDLCYKRITFGASPNPAPIYRMLQFVNDATIAFDEFAEKKGTDMHNELVQILN